MKQKTITTDKATLLFVEVSEVTRSVVLFTNEIGYYADGKNKYTKLPEGNWQLLGRLPDITEDNYKPFVHEYINQGKPIYMAYVTDTICFYTAKKVILAILQDNEICFENPLGGEPNREDEYYRDAMGVEYHYYDDLKKWQEVQSKVWDKERTYILTKVD